MTLEKTVNFTKLYNVIYTYLYTHTYIHICAEFLLQKKSCQNYFFKVIQNVHILQDKKRNLVLDLLQLNFGIQFFRKAIIPLFLSSLHRGLLHGYLQYIEIKKTRLLTKQQNYENCFRGQSYLFIYWKRTKYFT